jgi:iron complex transport system substrate-binding protein
MQHACFLLALAMAIFPPQEKGKVLYDDLNFPFPPASRPQRIISLAPNITEILFALGLGDKVVGVTRYCDYPPQATEKENVGGMVDPSIEKIQALHPDLIIAFRGNPLRILSKLKNLHFSVFILDTGKSLEDLFLTIEKIGRLTQEEKQAEHLLGTLKKKYRDVEQALSDVDLKPQVFLLLHGQGLWTCGKESFLNDLLVKAKGINIAGEIPRKWLQLSREQLIHKNPDLIIIMAKDEARFFQAKDRMLADSRLQKVSAIEKNDFHFLDEDIASRFGPRLLDAFLEVARILHPQKIKAEE